MKSNKRDFNNDDIEFQAIIHDLVNNKMVQKMKDFYVHGGVNCFDHCYSAAYYSYRICKKLKLDYISATRAAMLHDFYLYDWRIKNGHFGRHAFTHSRTAFNNACKYFKLNAKEKDIILKHMWPLTFRLPKYKESYILTLVDKQCASIEFITNVRHRFSKNKISPQPM